jgi:hypothetical protein
MSRTPLKACWFASPSGSAMRPSADDGAVSVSSPAASVRPPQPISTVRARLIARRDGITVQATSASGCRRGTSGSKRSSIERLRACSQRASSTRSGAFRSLQIVASEPAPARHRKSSGCWCQHATKDDGHMARRHRGQPQSESPGSRTLDLPASPKGRGESALEVGGDPGRILVGRRRRTRLLVPRVRVLPVVQVLGELRQLQRIEGVAHYRELVRLRHPD